VFHLHGIQPPPSPEVKKSDGGRLIKTMKMLENPPWKVKKKKKVQGNRERKEVAPNGKECTPKVETQYRIGKGPKAASLRETIVSVESNPTKQKKKKKRKNHNHQDPKTKPPTTTTKKPQKPPPKTPTKHPKKKKRKKPKPTKKHPPTTTPQKTKPQQPPLRRLLEGSLEGREKSGKKTGRLS